MYTIFLVISHLDTGNQLHHVIQLQPLDLRHHGELVLVMGSLVFLPVVVTLIIMLFIFIIKVWIIFLYVVETLVTVTSG